jgi:hypothetical protein
MSDVQERASKLAETMFVGGPVNRFEEVGRAQLTTLLQQGMTPQSKVLDVGGYWIMSYLESGCYFGIEPYREMLQAGLDQIVEPETLARARPVFDHNDSFDFGVFKVRFDYVIARSVWTHASRLQIRQMLGQFRESSTSDGVMLTSYYPAALRFVPGRRKYTLPAEHPRIAANLPSRPGYQGTEWAGRRSTSDEPKVVRHPFRWIWQECEEQDLRVRQLRRLIGGQHWLRIDRAA